MGDIGPGRAVHLLEGVTEAAEATSWTRPQRFSSQAIVSFSTKEKEEEDISFSSSFIAMVDGEGGEGGGDLLLLSSSSLVAV